MKKIFTRILLLFVVLIVWLVLVSRNTEEVILDHPMIGRVFSAGDKVFYMEDCNNFNSCGDTPRSMEINRTLVCGELNSTVTPIYNNSYQIQEDLAFELIELLKIESHGLNTIGGSGYVLAVLKDRDGLLSTRLFSGLGMMIDNPYGYKEGNICDGQQG